MLLSDEQIEQINGQFGIHPLPDDYPGMPEIVKVCGSHTFYLTANGLHIWEYTEAATEGNQAIKTVAVKVASWANEEKTDIAMHKPLLTDVSLELISAAPASAESVK